MSFVIIIAVIYLIRKHGTTLRPKLRELVDKIQIALMEFAKEL